MAPLAGGLRMIVTWHWLTGLAWSLAHRGPHMRTGSTACVWNVDPSIQMNPLVSSSFLRSRWLASVRAMVVWRSAAWVCSTAGRGTTPSRRCCRSWGVPWPSRRTRGWPSHLRDPPFERVVLSSSVLGCCCHHYHHRSVSVSHFGLLSVSFVWFP